MDKTISTTDSTGRLTARGAEMHLPWIDLLRIIACALVVLAHCCDSFVGAFDSDHTAFLTGASIGSLTRPSVPLFVLMTAILLLPLPQNTTLRQFYHKRVWRIIPPLIFWSIALPVLFYIYYANINPDTTNPTVDTTLYTPDNLWQKIWLMIVNFNFDTVPLWYLYMLIGLYFIMPVVNSWLVSADKRDIKLFLTLWGVSLFVPWLKLIAPHFGYTGNFGSMEVLGGCDWNAYSTFYYISGFVGYMVLAYYVRTYPPQWSRIKASALLIPMFIIGYVITFGGFVEIQNLFPGDYSYLEVIWYFSGFNVFMMTFPLLIFFSRLKIKPRKWMRKLAKLTFGIYLCHFIFVYISFDLYYGLGISPALKIAIMFATSFICATTVTWILSLTPFTRKFIY